MRGYSPLLPLFISSSFFFFFFFLLDSSSFSLCLSLLLLLLFLSSSAAASSRSLISFFSASTAVPPCYLVNVLIIIFSTDSSCFFRLGIDGVCFIREYRDFFGEATAIELRRSSALVHTGMEGKKWPGVEGGAAEKQDDGASS